MSSFNRDILVVCRDVGTKSLDNGDNPNISGRMTTLNTMCVCVCVCVCVCMNMYAKERILNSISCGIRRKEKIIIATTMITVITSCSLLFEIMRSKKSRSWPES
uniref:Uncharacterized protein n=1 Tax=Sipha flava TaxID=143950 RepID=A0A2S2QBW2_9HEMI